MMRTVHGVQLKQTEPGGYEFEVGQSDYHVRREGREWRLDQFDTSIKDAEEAHLASDAFPTLTEAVAVAVNGGLA